MKVMQNELDSNAKETPQVKEGMSGFRKTLLITAIPIAIISLVSLAVPVVWIFAAIIVAFALLIGIILLFTGAREIAAGILTGVGIGILVLGATCFANIGAW
jgi:hypothetical protein